MAAKLSYAQLEALWVKAGGRAKDAPVAAAIALAESGGNVAALNPRAPDYSVGLWQINYFGDLMGPRTRAYGPPSLLRSDPLANARAAVSISGNGNNFGPWTTYTNGAYRQYLQGDVAPDGGGIVAGVKGAVSDAAGAVAGAVPGLGPDVTDIVGGAKDAVVGVGEFLGTLADPNFWLRALQILGGAVLAFAGLALLVRQVALAADVPDPAGLAGAVASRGVA